LIRTLAEGEPFRCAGNFFQMLLPRDDGECCEVVLETVGPGHSTPPNQHATFVQIYVILRGEAKVTIGPETRTVRAPAVAFIPKDMTHSVSNESISTDVEYLYVSIWPDGIPTAEKDGGWREVYARMIQEYTDRGYPAERDGE
jgi:quercetin dioxygenase-like cupin family protein